MTSSSIEYVEEEADLGLRKPAIDPERLMYALGEAEPIIRDWLSDEGPNARDVAHFLLDRLGGGAR